MHDGAPQVLRFLFVHGLTTILLLGGLGVENQRIDLHEVLNFVLFCCGAGSHWKFTDHIQGNVMFRDGKFKAILSLFPLEFLKENCWGCVLHICLSVCVRQNAGYFVKM